MSPRGQRAGQPGTWCRIPHLCPRVSLSAATFVLVCGSSWANINLHILCVGSYISLQSVLPLQEIWWLVSSCVHWCLCCWLPVEPGASSLFALIQLPGLLNSNLGLKYFPIKTKPEHPPVGQQTRSTEPLGKFLMEELCLQQEAGFPTLETFCSLWYRPAVGVSFYLILNNWSIVLRTKNLTM